MKAIPLNARMLLERITGLRILVFHVGAASQIMHVEDVLKELAGRADTSRLAIYLLTKKAECGAARTKAKGISGRIKVHVDSVARFLLFCDFYSTVDQGEAFPLIGCKLKACSFHGQPSKGNVYQRFNFRAINILFFYGPLMRDHYLRTRDANPAWPKIPFYEVGQPLSDRRINLKIDKHEARARLGLKPSVFTAIYAPSFEYCSSLATHGRLIIETLLGLGINLIIKPHPAFYNAGAFDDSFNANIPNISTWREKRASYASRASCIFPEDNTLDGALSISASDVMVTDFSGVAFDGILQDLGMIFWDCPIMFDEYLPRRYGIDGAAAKEDLACNVGRKAGILVRDEAGLTSAVQTYRRDPGYLSKERREIRCELLFNPGTATRAMAGTIEELLSTGKA